LTLSALLPQMTDTTSATIRLEPALGSRLVRGAAGGLLLNILTNLFLFIGQLIIPRVLSRVEYAQFTVSISFVAMMSLVADLGMNSLFTRMFAEAEQDALDGHRDRRGTLFGSALLVRVCLSIFVVILVLLIAPALYPASMVTNMEIVLVTLFISSRLLIVRAVGESVLKSIGKFYLVAGFALADAIAFATALLLATLGHLTVPAVLLIYALSNIPGFLLLTVAIVKWCRSEGIRLHISFETIKSLLRGAIPLSAAIAFLTIHTEIDKLLLDRLSTPNEVASYGAIVRLMAAVIPIPMVLAYVAAPEVTRLLRKHDSVKSKRLTELALRFLLTAAVAIAIVLLPASTMMVKLFLGSKYAASGYLLQYIGWMLIPVFISSFLSEMTIAAGKSWPFTVYTAFIMLSVILGDILLIPAYGAAGAMTSKLIAVSLGTLLFLSLIWKADFFNAPKFRELCFKIFISATAVIMIAHFLSRIAIAEWLNAGLLLGLFLMAIHFLKVLSIADVRDMLARFRVGNL